MADFQFASKSNSPSFTPNQPFSKQVEEFSQSVAKSSGIFEYKMVICEAISSEVSVIPPLFSRIDIPQEYRFTNPSFNIKISNAC
jgi:hypothetical protein